MVKSCYNKLFGITTYLLDENETIEDLERYEAEIIMSKLRLCCRGIN
jgi:hypothetical protein